MRYAHDQLATTRAVEVNVLVDGAAVAGLQAAQRGGQRLFLADQRDRIACVGRVAEQIVDSRIALVGRGKGHRGVSAADVEDVEATEVVGLAVHGHRARAADVEHAKLAALGEVLGTQLGLGGQGERRCQRHCHADDRALQIHVGQIQLARLTQIGEKVGLAQFLGGHTGITHGVGGHECLHLLVCPLSALRTMPIGNRIACAVQLRFYSFGKSRGFQLSVPRRKTSGAYCLASSGVRKWVWGSRSLRWAPSPVELNSA